MYSCRYCFLSGPGLTFRGSYNHHCRLHTAGHDLNSVPRILQLLINRPLCILIFNPLYVAASTCRFSVIFLNVRCPGLCSTSEIPEIPSSVRGLLHSREGNAVCFISCISICRYVDSGSGGRSRSAIGKLLVCQSVLEQDTEPPTTPGVQAGTLDSSLCHRFVNG